MTSRRLPETDIANICHLSERDQLKRLRGKRSFVPPHSLDPVRRNLNPLFGVTSPMFPEKAIDEASALSALRGGCKKHQDIKPNLLRAEAILDFSRSSVEFAVEETFRSHRVTLDNQISLTHSLAIQIDSQPVIPFLDLRKSGALSSEARDVVFALNFHLIVDAFADFNDFGLVILNYWENSPQEKGLTPYFFNSRPKYTYEQLTNMIARTYEIWLEILDDRRRDSDANSDYGPLFA